jgi:hypothetical protein
MEPVAWDVYEHRVYGAPGETRHRVLWVEHYRIQDGSTPDLDWLLKLAYEKGGTDGGAKTIHVRPLIYGDSNAH